MRRTESAVARLRLGASRRRSGYILDTRLGEGPQFPGARQADAVDDRVDPLGKSRRDRSAVAPGRAGRNALRLQHPNRPAAPRQLARNRRPGKSGPDHAGIDVEVVVERGPLRRRDHGRRIPGRAVGMVPFGHCPLMPRRQGSRKPAIFFVESDRNRDEPPPPTDAAAPCQGPTGPFRAPATMTAR